MSACVCYFVESCMHLIHQVDVELAHKRLQRLRVSERISLPHLVTHHSDHCILHTKNTRPCCQFDKRGIQENILGPMQFIIVIFFFYLYLLLEVEISSRDVEAPHQLSQHLLWTYLFWQMAFGSKQFIILL